MKVNPLLSVNFLKLGSENKITAAKIADLAEVDFSREISADENKILQELLQWEEHEENIKNKNIIKNIKKQHKWNLKKIPLKFYIVSLNKDTHSEKLMPQFIKAAENSFHVWSRASLGLIRFEKTLNPDNADILVYWSTETLAERTYEAGHSDLEVINNEIRKAEITLIVFPVIDLNLSSENRIERVRRTALHEIGHVLGLEHSNNEKDVMFHRGIYNKNLSHTDIKRLSELYKTKDLDVVT